jgi:hypothetical protein
MTDKLWPFGSLSDCPHLCCNTWFGLDGRAYPEGLPFTEGAIDFEWSCQATAAAAIAPLIGTASDASTGELYFWLSDRLLNENNLPLLCRVGSKVQTLRAHNVPADRTKIYESYQTADTIHWADTMANHTLLSGPCSGQSMLMRQVEAGKLQFKPWFMDSTSLKNILAVHNFWLPEAEPLLPQDKKLRDIFYKGSMAEIRASFVELMNYSLKDASLVNQIYDAQQTAWSRQVPSEIRRRAALLRANVSLAISPDFEDWLAVCEAEYQKSSTELNNLAEDLVRTKVKDFSSELRSSLAADLQPLPAWFTKSGKLMKKWQCPIKQN